MQSPALFKKSQDPLLLQAAARIAQQFGQCQRSIMTNLKIIEQTVP